MFKKKSKNKIMTKLINLNCDKVKTIFFTKFNNSYFTKLKLKILQLQNSNSDKTQTYFVTKLK